MDLNSIERETIGLCISLEAIDSMVNYGLLELCHSDQNPEKATVYFKTPSDRSLFIIRFLDFAKETGDSRLTGVSGSCLKVLSSSCKNKNFNIKESIGNLKNAVDEFSIWLDYKSTLKKMWLPTLDIEATIEISRMECLHISGNQSKHNISRLTGVSKAIHNILESHGYRVPLELIPLALEDFEEHLNEDYFIYYGTWIVELLNNIRWGLYRYLLPTYGVSHRMRKDGFRYIYKYPDGIHNDISKLWFWRLMNHIRRGPLLKEFIGSSSLKKQSSLEWDDL